MQRAWACGRDLDPEVCGAPPGFFMYRPGARGLVARGQEEVTLRPCRAAAKSRSTRCELLGNQRCHRAQAVEALDPDFVVADLNVEAVFEELDHLEHTRRIDDP